RHWRSTHHGRIPTTGKRTSPRMSDLLRSSAVPILPAAAELLKDLSGVLARWGGWYLFGAQAVIAHGVPRLSADVDVTLRMTPEDPERFAHEMAQAGFDLAVHDPEFVRRTRVMPFIHRGTAMPLDFVLAG